MGHGAWVGALLLGVRQLRDFTIDGSQACGVGNVAEEVS